MKQKKVLVAGLGLIGGSMAAAISEKTPHLVYGYDIDTETQQKALADGAIAQAWEKDGDFDLVLIALYPSAAISFLENFGPSFASSCVVVDLCGVKQSVCQAARKIFTKGKATFVGGHPMAGREVWGYAGASVKLFEKASMILTPFDDTPKETLALLEEFFLSVGFGRITYATPYHHDEMIAYTSQLAHVVSAAYVCSPLALETPGFSAGSFKDMTRVARLNEHMWAELFLHNRECLISQMDHLIDNLVALRKAIAQGDRLKLEELLAESRKTKEAIL